MNKRILAAFFLGGFLALIPTLIIAGPTKDYQSSTQTETSTQTQALPLGQLLADTPELSTLNTALQEAGLIETVEGLDAYTVFAPTNEAFEQLDPAQLEALLADKEALTSVLTYHVVPENLMASDLEAQDYETVEGTSVPVEINGEEVTVDGATVSATDIMSQKGIVHLIDSVLVPEGLTLPEPAQ